MKPAKVSRAAPVSQPPADVGTSLAVPIGGPGVGWAFAVRWAFVYSLPQLMPFFRGLWDAPYPLFSRYVTFQSDGGALHHFVYEVLAAVILAGIWMALDRKRRHETLIHEVTRVLCRYAMARILLHYGLEKIIASQGAWALDPRFLIHPFGEQSGCAAMMSWLSYSTVFAQFSGWVEAGAGLLMLSRRFTTIAALLAVASLINVAFVNQSNCGIFATMSPIKFLPLPLFLVAPYFKRLTEVLLLARPSKLDVGILKRPGWMRPAGLALKIIVVPLAIWGELAINVERMQLHAQRSPLEGVYQVQRFERNGVEEPVAYDFPQRWREVAIGPLMDEIAVRTSDDTHLNYWINWELAIERLAVFRRGSAKQTKEGKLGALQLTRSADDELVLEGTIDGTQVRAHLRRVGIDSLPFFRYRWKPL